MKRTLALLAVLFLVLLPPPSSRAEKGKPSGKVTYGHLLADLLVAYESGGDSSRIDADVEALGDEVARSIAEHWKQVYLDPDYKLFIYGTDDPAGLPVRGKHAFVVLGYELKNGGMTPELMGRCDAAAAAARAFPDSILVCSGGATGSNNPHHHTEAGLMKAYLSEQCGIAPERIWTDERARTTVDNAVNTFAILREQGIETMTIVTSAYHQRWGQVLYNALAAQYLQQYGYRAEIVGNFCFEIEPSNKSFKQDARIAITQLARILNLPRSQMKLLP